MKTLHLTASATCLLLIQCAAWGDLIVNYSNKGSDGAFVSTGTNTVDLSSANTGAWDSMPARPGTGVYDPERWAVVFKFSSVRIPGNSVVRFKNNVSAAPVVMLVDGDVVVNGQIILDGDSGGNSEQMSKPGPGGYPGGFSRGLVAGTRESGGFGPGGGNLTAFPQNSPQFELLNNGAAFAEARLEMADKRYSGPGNPYGNAQLIPLIGGSGGGGAIHGVAEFNGGGGGGALLLVARGRIEINGVISANGGNAISAGGGSGGGIRLVCDELSGDGTVRAKGGSVLNGDRRTPMYSAGGSNGRIRIESHRITGLLNTQPIAPWFQPETPAKLWPDDSDPSARIVRVSGQQAPAAPNGTLNLAPIDLSIVAEGKSEIVVETTRISQSSDVIVRIVPLTGPAQEVKASFVSQAGLMSTWVASADLHQGLCTLQVRAKSK